ncbi:MAG: peptidylprolyl isomerase [Gemmatimonadales bacterium]
MRRSAPLLLLFALPALVPTRASAQDYDVGRIRTRLGEILVYLHPETPNHKASFLRLAAAHYWDSLTFNRVIPDFVAQGGCPDTPEGFGGSPYNLAPEFNDSLRHVYGAFGAGRDDNPGKLSAGCQFYIVANRAGLKRLDGNYVIYGQVIQGMNVVEAIVHEPRDSADAPLTRIPLTVDALRMTREQLEAYGFTPR